PSGGGALVATVDRIGRAYLKITGWLLRAAAILLLSIMVAINAAEVVVRGATGGGLGWAQELSIILAMGLYFLCYALVAKEDEFIRVEILVKSLPIRLQTVIGIVVRLVIIG